jgi:hypothetical protein
LKAACFDLDSSAGSQIPSGEVLDGLREAGLITYPSPLLRRFLEELPDVFDAEVLPWLDPTARACTN